MVVCTLEVEGGPAMLNMSPYIMLQTVRLKLKEWIKCIELDQLLTLYNTFLLNEKYIY